MFNNTNPNDVVSSLKSKWADLYKSISKVETNDIKGSTETQKIIHTIPGSDTIGLADENQKSNEQ
jgi:hypothetical protein